MYLRGKLGIDIEIKTTEGTIQRGKQNTYSNEKESHTRVEKDVRIHFHCLN